MSFFQHVQLLKWNQKHVVGLNYLDTQLVMIQTFVIQDADHIVTVPFESVFAPVGDLKPSISGVLLSNAKRR